MNLEVDSFDGGYYEDFALCFQFISKCLITSILFALEPSKKDVDVKEAAQLQIV